MPKEAEGKWQANVVMRDEEPVEKQQAVFMGEAPDMPEVDDELFGDARPGEGVGEIEDFDENAEEDCAPKQVSPDPGQPTQSEIDDHNVDHFPFRCWCEPCVTGRGVGEAHRGESKREGGNTVPVIAFDYLFITKEHVWRREELTDEESKKVVFKVLVVKDTKGKAVFAHVIHKKGVEADGYSVARLAEDVRWLGYRKIIPKSDNEPAILQLLREALKGIKTDLEWIEQVGEEHPPAYDSRSNGSVENAVKHVQGYLRTMKISLEAQLRVHVPPQHPIIAWLVEHVAWLLTVRPRGEDGKTAYQRVRGRQFGKRLMEFGERCLYKRPMKGPRHEAQGKLAERWRRGLFLGFSRTSNEYYLWDVDTVVKARAVQRMRRELRWPEDGLENVSMEPHHLYPARGPTPAAFAPGGDEQVSARQEPIEGRPPQGIQIRRADWELYGSSPGCPRCMHADTYGWGQTKMVHSKECIERYRQCYSETEEGKKRLDEADLRQLRYVERLSRRARGEAQQARGEAVRFEAARGELPMPAAAQAEGEQERPRPDPSPATAPAAAAPSSLIPPVFERSGDEAEDADDADNLPAAPDEHMGDEQHQQHGDDEMIGNLEEILDLCDEQDGNEVKKLEREIMTVVRDLGGSRRAYSRERGAQMKAVVSEIYSPPRVTACAKLLPSLNVIAGFAMDLTTADHQGVPWDFDILERRVAARRMIEEQQPVLLVGSPMCTAFCTWQRLNELKRDPVVTKREYVKAMVHLQFVCELYRVQMDSGRYFLHEHPVGASSWKEACIDDLLSDPRVERVTGDQCQYGQQAYDGSPVKKPTGWMSNGEKILESLSRRCRGRGGQCSRTAGGAHKMCAGGRVTRDAAIYPMRLCKAILQGCRRQLQEDDRLTIGVVGIQALDVEESENKLQRRVEKWHDVRIEEEVLAMQAKGETLHRDAITGQALITELVRAARKEELRYFALKGVWKKKPRREAFEKTGKPPITVKWVDVNKGDDIHPRYRSRLVAREIRHPGEESIFAPTPPLESLRTVLSLAATDPKGCKKHIRDPKSEERTQVQMIDISRAYFNAKIDGSRGPTFVELPAEDPDKAKGMCGELLVHLYGTRPAAEGWHDEYAGMLESLGFSMGAASACVFSHREKRIVTTVHGDDFTSSGPKVSLDWLREQLKAKYELVEQARLGPGQHDDTLKDWNTKRAPGRGRRSCWTLGSKEPSPWPPQA